MFDAFMRCAGVGAGMLDDENVSLDELGSVKGTPDGMSQSQSEDVGQCCFLGPSPLSKLDVSAATSTRFSDRDFSFSPSPLRVWSGGALVG